MNIKSKQWENAQYNENSLLFNTYSRSQKQRQHTQPGSLKISNQNPKNQQKKNPSKRQLFHLSRPMLYSKRSTVNLPTPTGGVFYIQQLDLYGWICQEIIPSPELSVRQDLRTFFFFFTKILSTEFQTKMYCLRHLFFIHFLFTQR